MCFSATGSFAVATVIAGVGAVAINQDKPPSHRMLALVPLLFAAQQVARGRRLDDHRPPDAGLAVSLLATFMIERQTLTSVWCFFAAILSVLIVLSISKDHRLIIKPA